MANTQYRMMGYRIASAWPTADLGMGDVYTLPDGWTRSPS